MQDTRHRRCLGSRRHPYPLERLLKSAGTHLADLRCHHCHHPDRRSYPVLNKPAGRYRARHRRRCRAAHPAQSAEKRHPDPIPHRHHHRCPLTDQSNCNWPRSRLARHPNQYQQIGRSQSKEKHPPYQSPRPRRHQGRLSYRVPRRRYHSHSARHRYRCLTNRRSLPAERHPRDPKHHRHHHPHLYYRQYHRGRCQQPRGHLSEKHLGYR